MASAGKLGELLEKEGLVTRDQLNQALQLSKKDKIRFGNALLQLGHVNENVYVTFLSKIYGISAMSLDQIQPSKDIIEMIPKGLCQKHNLVPVKLDEQKLMVAISDPSNIGAVDDVRFLSNVEVEVTLATHSAISAAIERLYREIPDDPGKSLNEVMSSYNEIEDEQSVVASASEDDSHEVDAGVDTQKPVIRIINVVLAEAIKRRTSDIHIEPHGDGARVRLRIDGRLHEVMKIPAQLKAGVPARVKVMASLDISEKRLPQDGRLSVRTKKGRTDIRVSILPTVLGEKVVMRVLGQQEKVPTLVELGFEEKQFHLFKEAAEQPYGMVLVTGPTGSGKSTTLFAALNELNSSSVNLSTVEDPVEYRMAGVNQVQTKEAIGLNFAAGLRSLLRQDPDVIMIGEIRDTETAEIAVKSALTGHMVFSTLHTNDAPSTVTRLVHMGVEPFLVTASLSLVQAQRLIRVNCSNCLEDDPNVNMDQVRAAEMPDNWFETFKPKRGKGCDLCAETGYKGRRGIFEVMALSEEIRDMIIRGANADQIKRVAVKNDMITLRQSALIKLYRGETTLEEVLNNSRPDGDGKST